jgi:8-oxo-dGTP pyrophosphatase MutT (NUDIX family)
MTTNSLSDLLSLLRAHAVQPLDPNEAAMTADAIQFAEAHGDCLRRSCRSGHFTGSAWMVDATRRWTLLTYHHKLHQWLQPGGHADGESALLAVALREAREESGLARLRPVAAAIFDFDRHRIPARGAEPEHWHYDARFLIEADRSEPLVVSSESKELAWVEVARVAELNPAESMLRPVRKTVAANG